MAIIVSDDRRSALTVLELLVAMGMVALLAGLILPALGAAREAARRTACASHLRQIGLALQYYADTHQCLPAGWQVDASANGARGWAVPLLPYLEQRSMHGEIVGSASLADASNRALGAGPLTLLLCPSDLIEPVFELVQDIDDEDQPVDFAAARAGVPEVVLMRLPSANYVGVFGNAEPDEDDPVPIGEGAFIESRPVRMPEFRRGLSNTLFVGERTMARLPSTWLGVDLQGEDARCRLVGNAATGPNCPECDECEFASRHAGGANFLYGDGHVALVADGIDSHAYRALARRIDF